MVTIPRVACLLLLTTPVANSVSVVARARGGAKYLTYATSAERDAATRCFAGYVNYSSSRNTSQLQAVCPSWRQWVTTTGEGPDKIHAAGTAIVLGQRQGSDVTGHYGSIRDGGVDLGCGFNCDRGKTGRSEGVHVLSIPVQWFSDCCSNRSGSVAHAIAEGRSKEVCPMFRDSIVGGLQHAGEYSQVDQATDASQTRLFSQCYHLKPEVWTLHLHTVAGVVMIEGVLDMGLGPEPYNACVCETPTGGGRCPSLQPWEAGYVQQATQSLCFNVALAGKVPPATAEAVCGACG